MQQRNIYEVLGVSPTASPEEIKAAYRELAKKYHPDTLRTYIEKVRATKKMQEINFAYEILKDLARRTEYDQTHAGSIRDKSFNEERQEAATPRGAHKRTTSVGRVSSTLGAAFKYPFRAWVVVSVAVSPLVFILIELDSYLGLGWLATGKGSIVDHMFLAVLVAAVLSNPFLWFLIFPIILTPLLFLYLLFAIPFVAISEGLKTGFRKRSKHPKDGPRGLLLDLTVRLVSLAALVVLAAIFPQIAIGVMAAFPYNIFILYGLATWCGEVVALVVYLRRGRKVVETTEILLAT